MTGVRSAAQREADATLSFIVWANAGEGKTRLVTTLPPKKTVIINAENGLKSIRGFAADDIPVSSWREIEYICQQIQAGNLEIKKKDGSIYCDFRKYEHIFIDSATRIANFYAWKVAQDNPSNYSSQGNFIPMQAYDQVNRMMDYVFDVFHNSPFNVWFTGGLKDVTNDAGTVIGSKPYMPGSSARGAPYQFDISCVLQKGKLHMTPPKKVDLSSKVRFALDGTEEPDLLALWHKCLGGEK